MKKNNFKIVKLKPTKESSIKRTVFIKDFIIEEIIGVHEHEKIRKQKIKFNVVLDVNQSSVPDVMDIKSIVDYEKITNKLENLTKGYYRWTDTTGLNQISRNNEIQFDHIKFLEKTYKKYEKKKVA